MFSNSYLLAYDCVRFNTYLENLLSSHSSQMVGIGGGDRRDRPAWLGTPAADTIFTVARNRVYLQKKVVPPSEEGKDGKGKGKQREMSVDGFEIPDDLGEEEWYGAGPTAEEEEMLREIEEAEVKRIAALSGGGDGPASAAAKDKDKAAMPPPPLPQTPAPKPKPKRSRWQPPGVEPVLEEQPKWLLLADVLDEIETQMHWADHDPCASPPPSPFLLLPSFLSLFPPSAADRRH